MSDTGASGSRDAQGRLERLAIRMLVCSPEVPPLETGHAMVLGRLFREIDPADYCFVGFGPPQTHMPAGDHQIEARSYRLPSSWRPGSTVRSGYPLRPVRAIRHFSTEVFSRARRLATLVHDERCGALMVTSSYDTPDVAASLLAARLARVPLFVYMLDNWRHMVTFFNPELRVSAPHLQSIVLAGARGVFVQNEFIGAELWRDSGRHSTVIAIPLPDSADLGDQPPIPWPDSEGEIRLVFTGQVYGAHIDAIARVLAALDSPRLPPTTLHVYGSTPEDRLRKHGLTGRLKVHEHVAGALIGDIQRRADILLLALAFDSPYPEIIRAAAPTKTGEYLASGRPILIHAPPDSYLAALANKHGVGALVDKRDTDLIVDAILRIAHDKEYRTQITRAARMAARRFYSPRSTTQRFLSTVNRLVAKPMLQ